MGQFLSPDSADANQGNGQGMDPYAYVKGNPETMNDPTGHWGWGNIFTSIATAVVMGTTPVLGALGGGMGIGLYELSPGSHTANGAKAAWDKGVVLLGGAMLITVAAGICLGIAPCGLVGGVASLFGGAILGTALGAFASDIGSEIDATDNPPPEKEKMVKLMGSKPKPTTPKSSIEPSGGVYMTPHGLHPGDMPVQRNNWIPIYSAFMNSLSRPAQGYTNSQVAEIHLARNFLEALAR